MAESPKQQLLKLENACRRQIFNVIYDTKSTAERKVREANCLCAALIRTLPTTMRTDLIQAKNEAILHLQTQVKAKNHELLSMYVRMKRERQKLEEVIVRGDGELFLQVLTSPAFEKYRPVLFHQDLQVTEVLPLTDTLSRCSRLYALLPEIQALKEAACRLFKNNDSMDLFTLLETCHRLRETPLEIAYVLQPKWEICLSITEVLVSQTHLVKAVIHQALENAHEDLADAISVEEEIRDYAELCEDTAQEYRQTNRKQEAGYWLRICLKIRNAIDHEDNKLKIAYAEALRLAKGFDKLFSLLYEVLGVLEAEDLKNDYQWNAKDRAIIMQQLAWTARDFLGPMKAVDWYRRILALKIEDDIEEVEIEAVKLELASILTKLNKFEEAEAVLVPLIKASEEPDIRLCDACGSLYLAWEKFAICEQWLQRGLSQRPKDPLALLITFTELCLKLDRFDEAKSYLSSCLRSKTQKPIDKVYIFLLMWRYCLQREEYLEVYKWVAKSIGMQNTLDTTLAKRSTLFCYSGIVEMEMGDHVKGIKYLQNVESLWEEQQIVFMGKLAEAYLQIGDLKKAEAQLSLALKRTELISDMTPSAAVFVVQGRVCLAKQQLSQAREWLQRALTIQERVIPQTRETARTYTVFGLLELANERYEQACERFTQALNILGPCVGAAEAYSGLAEMYEKTGEWKSATDSLETGLKLLQFLPKHPLAIKMQSQLLHIKSR